MDFNLSDDQRQFGEAVRKFARAELADGALQRANSDEIPKEIARRMAEIGLLGITIPEQKGRSRRNTC